MMKEGINMSEMMSNVNVLMEKDVKDEANQILKEMGLNMSTYINMAVRQLINDEAIPFKVTIKNNQQPPKEINMDLMSKEELIAKLSSGIEDYHNGNVYDAKEALEKFKKRNY